MNGRASNVDPFEIIQSVDEPLFVLNEEYAIVFGNRAFDTIFGFSRQEIEGNSLYEIAGGKFDHPKIRDNLNQVFTKVKNQVTFDLEHDFPNIGMKKFIINAGLMRRYGSSDADQMLVRFEDITQRVAAENALLQKTMEILELSSPITKVWDEILVLPLIGTLDNERATRMIQQLLETIRKEGARYIIMDGTGVSGIDQMVASHIIKAISAVKLLGAYVILTGIKPEVAMMMVQLGIDIRDIVSRATLQEGVHYALDSRGYVIMRKGSISRDEQNYSSRDNNEQKSTLRIISPYPEP